MPVVQALSGKDSEEKKTRLKRQDTRKNQERRNKAQGRFKNEVTRLKKEPRAKKQYSSALVL